MKLRFLQRRIVDRILIWSINHFDLLGSQEEEAPHFFILSSGRSGSTLLRKLLMESSPIYIPPETQSLIPESARLFLLHPFASWEKKIDKFIILIERMKINEFWLLNLELLRNRLNQLPKKERSYRGVINLFYRTNVTDANIMLIGDKTPYLSLQASWIGSVFPKSKIIHLVRDGRDVVVSRMKAFDESMIDAANRWLWTIKEAGKFQKKGVYTHTIKYEDLVNDSDKTMASVIQFLNVPKIELKTNSPVFLGDDKLKHHVNLKKALFNTSVGKWKEVLSLKEQNALLSLLDNSLKQTGYF